MLSFVHQLAPVGVIPRASCSAASSSLRIVTILHRAACGRNCPGSMSHVVGRASAGQHLTLYVKRGSVYSDVHDQYK